MRMMMKMKTKQKGSTFISNSGIDSTKTIKMKTKRRN